MRNIHPNLMIKMLSGNIKNLYIIFSRFQQYAWAYVRTYTLHSR